MYISGVTPFSSMLAAELGHVGSGEFGIHGGMDQFHMMDPMEMRHGVFAWNGQNFTGGRIGENSSREIALTRQSLTQALFSGYRAPTDGNVLAHVAKHDEINKLLQEGNVLAWNQDIEGEKIPCVFALCELPVSPDQIFDTLLDVNGIDSWMPRANWFKSDDPDAQSLVTMRKRFNGRRSARIDDIATRYKTSVPQFYGRLAVDYRQLSGGALQMEWNVHGDQTKPTDPKKIGLETPKEIAGLKPMKINNCSFTLIPSPERSDRTVCAYHINAQPVDFPFVMSPVILFITNQTIKELAPLFQSLLNRSINRNWTAKRKDPEGLELGLSPTPHRVKVHKVI